MSHSTIVIECDEDHNDTVKIMVFNDGDLHMCFESEDGREEWVALSQKEKLEDLGNAVLQALENKERYEH